MPFLILLQILQTLLQLFSKHNKQFPDWDDSYEFLLGLTQDLGWQFGTFTLTWTLPSTNPQAVRVDSFVIAAAVSTFQPVTFMDADDTASITPLFPPVWVEGNTYLAFWADEPLSYDTFSFWGTTWVQPEWVDPKWVY